MFYCKYEEWYLHVYMSARSRSSSVDVRKKSRAVRKLSVVLDFVASVSTARILAHMDLLVG